MFDAVKLHLCNTVVSWLEFDIIIIAINMAGHCILLGFVCHSKQKYTGRSKKEKKNKSVLIITAHIIKKIATTKIIFSKTYQGAKNSKKQESFIF